MPPAHSGRNGELAKWENHEHQIKTLYTAFLIKKVEMIFLVRFYTSGRIMNKLKRTLTGLFFDAEGDVLQTEGVDDIIDLHDDVPWNRVIIV